MLCSSGCLLSLSTAAFATSDEENLFADDDAIPW